MSQTEPAPESAKTCFHCGLPIPKNINLSVSIFNQPRPMCCEGCKAVAETIVENGLDQYYQYRDGPSQQGQSLVPKELEQMNHWDDPQEQQTFVRQQGEQASTTLVVDGITCAACAWLIEHELRKEPSVSKASLNLSNHRLNISWDNQQKPLSELIIRLRKIGYKVRPFQQDSEQQARKQEFQRALRRLIVAGLGMMQVMMYAVGLYAGALQGIEAEYKGFLRWTSLLVATPVVFYAASPFFVAAWRGIRSKHPGMDLPVALAIGSAYVASCWATVNQSGEVYFDSVCMFTFFLTIGRFLEMRARHKTGETTQNLLELTPSTATLIADDDYHQVPVKDLKAGDLILVKAGQTLPIDGVIIKGESSVSEAMLTGEADPKPVKEGETILSGSQNLSNPLQVEVTKSGGESTLSTIVALLERAQADKPQFVQLVDRIASWFVVSVVLIAACVYFTWTWLGSDHAFWITLSVLVATCPCALSLATPTVLTTATNRLAEAGFLITRGHVLQALPKIKQVIFDKTGTLTVGRYEIVNSEIVNSETVESETEESEPLSNDQNKYSIEQCLEIAAALERDSEHPIAHAFKSISTELKAESLEVKSHLGMTGTIHFSATHFSATQFNNDIENEVTENVEFHIGSAKFMNQLGFNPQEQSGQWIFLANNKGLLARFRLDDQLRRESPITVSTLQEMGLNTVILSGDNSDAVNKLAQRLHITDLQAGLNPAEKLAYVETQQAKHCPSIMVGDGINDAPVLAAASVSLAMGGGTDLAKTSADAVLLNDQLNTLVDAFKVANKTQLVIRQNLVWSLAYNLSILPLAALGLVPPYIAAIGMSFSSLLVVLNALRVRKAI